MGKKWLFVLGAVNVLAVAGIIFWYVNRDHTPPVITQEAEIIYEHTMSDSELLKGAVAYDETDGDVSHTLVVEKITVNHNTGIATVTCGAMDESGNIAKQSFKVTMAESEFSNENSESDPPEDVFTLEAGEAANGNDIEEQTSENETSEEAEEVGVSEETADNEEAEATNTENDNTDSEAEGDKPDAEEDNVEQPILTFGAPEVKTKVGSNPAWVTVISQLQDNKDNYEYLLQHLKISGEFTNGTVGSYDVMVSTVDSDGNESVARAIRITVEQ